jgi:hypothetical protein
MTAEDYDKLKTFTPGSPEEQLFIMQKSFIESMLDQHETLEHVFRDFSNSHGNTKPLISMFDVLYVSQNLPLLETPSVKKPDSSIGLNCHPILLNSIDTFPVHLGRSPHSDPDAYAIYREANKPENMDFLSREISRAYWKKVQGLGATVNYRWQVYHTVQAMPDHLMTLGVPISTSHAVICGQTFTFFPLCPPQDKPVQSLLSYPSGGSTLRRRNRRARRSSPSARERSD